LTAGLAGRSKLRLAGCCTQGEGQGNWSHQLRLLDTATEDSSLGHLAILGLGSGGRLGHSSLGEEPWASDIGLQKLQVPSAKKGL